MEGTRGKTPRGKPKGTRPQHEHDHIDGRPPYAWGQPGAVHTYAQTPALADLVDASGLTPEEIAGRLRDQGHGAGTLRSLENGEPMPRIVVSRITAALGISHAAAKGEV